MDNGLKKRSYIPSLFALAKKQLTSVLTTLVESKVFKVSLSNDAKYQEYLARIANKLDTLTTSIKNLPKIEMKGTPASINIQPISGDVINKLSKTLEKAQFIISKQRSEKFPIREIVQALASVEKSVKDIQIPQPVQQKEIVIPEFPKDIGLSNSKEILVALKELKQEIAKLPKKYPEVDIPSSIEVSNFPPQHIPTPVTHMSINSLGGTVKARSVTVSTTLTPLPGEVLENRRSLVVFNNSSATTIYMGGSNVTSANGVPVTAKTYSPPIDAGDKMIVYAVTASGTADCRTLEVSDLGVGR